MPSGRDNFRRNRVAPCGDYNTPVSLVRKPRESALSSSAPGSSALSGNPPAPSGTPILLALTKAAKLEPARHLHAHAFPASYPRVYDLKWLGSHKLVFDQVSGDTFY